MTGHPRCRLSPEQRQANRQRLQALMEDLNLRHE